MLPDAFQPTFGQPCIFNPMETGMAIEGLWPSLFIGADRVPVIRRKTETLAWAGAALARMRAEAEIVLHETPHFVTEWEGEPIGSAGRCGMFSDTGHYHLFDPQKASPQWDPHHRASVQPDAKALRAWTVLQHERTRRLIGSMGFLFALTGDQRYAHWGWDGLRALATVYEAYAGTHDEEKTPYRYFYGGLYEAQCQLQVVQALELLANAPGVSADDVARIRENVIAPGCAAIDRWMDVMMVHNMSAWGMSAICQGGRLLGRTDWIEKAFGSERCGVKTLLEVGLPRKGQTGAPDGFWFEHSPFYGCFYVVTAITPLVRAAEAAGVMTDDLRERYASFYHAMPRLADSELRLLSISDRVAPGTMRLTQARHLYEYAAGEVDAGHAPLLAYLYAQCGAPRIGWAALAFGPDDLPAPCPPPVLTRSGVLSEAGLATFRAETPRGQATLWFQNLNRYPGSAQGHHHMDKLSLSLHAFGAVLTSDLGWPGMESKESLRGPYLSGTLSHNTLMLDEYDQGSVETLSFETDMATDVPWARGSFRGKTSDKMWNIFQDHHGGRLQERLYDDATITRTVWFDFPRVIVLDRLEAGSEKRFGFAFHARGQLAISTLNGDNPAALSLPALPDEGAWSLFTGRASADPVCRFVADWRVRSDIHLRMLTLSDGPFDAHWGSTPDNPADTTRGTIYLRAPGKARRFATVLEVHPGTPTVAGVRIAGQRDVHVVTYAGDEKRYALPEL